jgi:glycosyltransferase involved in cell wall biosynthesis
MATPSTSRESGAPAVSIIVPTYNRAQVLADTLRAILAQTFPDFEAIVVDDGSPDGTAAAVEALGDARIRYRRIANTGRPAGPRNIGLAMARGRYIAFCDDDDPWFPAKLARQVAYLESHPQAGLVCCNAEDFPARGALNITFASLLRENPIVISSAVARRERIEAAGLFDEDVRLKAVEDYDYWLRMFALPGMRGHRLADKLLRYNRETAGIGRDATPAGRRLTYRKILRVYAKFAADPARRDMVRRAKRRQLRSLVSTALIRNFSRSPAFMAKLWRSPCLLRTKLKLSARWLGLPA